jgi:sugar/nucleoside kinase (ribokinase family)
MTTMKDPVACLGILVADVVGRPMQALPEPGRLVLVDEMGLYTGGCAVNAATALVNLGLPVEVIGKVGSDPFGDYIVDVMQERGIGTRGVKRDPETGTSTTMVMVDPDGERRFVHFIGANAKLTKEDIDLQLVAGASILNIGGSLVLPGIDGEPTADLLRYAQSNGVITFLDTVWDDTGRWMALLEPSLPYIDYFIPSLPEAQAIVGLQGPQEVAQALLNHGPKVVGLKMGSDGCLVMNEEGETIQFPAYDVQVVDATGAGDAFAAGFIAGVWLGWPLDKTVRFASAVGALCVTGVGASGGVRSLQETLRFMENTPLKRVMEL